MPRHQQASSVLFIENAREYPATVALLCLTCLLFLVFGLMRTEDQALLLATNSASPLRIRLWDDGTTSPLPHDSARDEVQLAAQQRANTQEALQKTHEARTGKPERSRAPDDGDGGTATRRDTEATELDVGRWLWLNVQWVVRFTCGSLIVSTSGTLLATVAALWLVARPVEEAVGLHSFVFTVILVFVLRLAWVVLVLTVMGQPASVQYSMQPGLTWLLSALYVYYEGALRSGGNAGEASEGSRLRLFGKLPIGAETVRLVLLIHLAMRDDVSMSLVPGIAAGLLLSTSAAQTFLRHLSAQLTPQGSA